jgi:hypothetical protein
MQVKFSFYTKKNGDFIIYANGSNGTSIAMDATGFPNPYSREMTSGKRNLLSAAIEALGSMPIAPEAAVIDWDGFVGRRLENQYGKFAEKITDDGRQVLRIA